MSPCPRTLSIAHAGIILDSIADGVFTVDEHMRITFFNHAAERITGIDCADAMGRSCAEVLRATICGSSCALRCSFETGENIIDRNVTILRADGTEVPISISTAVLRDVDGRIVGGVESFRDLTPLVELRNEIRKVHTFQDIVSRNHSMRRLFDVLPRIAESGSTVLIQGPSGSGKELFARAIHMLSPRKNGPFVGVNCGALPDTLLESELFGYTKGAFTDAKRNKPGRFAQAAEGTLFMDEVDSLTPATQVKLLRVLQEMEYQPLGADAPVRADVRVIAATKESLHALVTAGRFRDDLFFRLNIVLISLPALRERRDDIPLLVEHFVKRFNRKMQRHVTGLRDDALALLLQYSFPGNVRELENLIEHAFVMCQDAEIRPEHFPPELLRAQSEENRRGTRPVQPDLDERERIRQALLRHGGNRSAAARELGIHRTTLWRKIDRYQL